MISSEDAKTIGIIGSLLVSSTALFLNFYSTLRSIKSQKISNYQEIIKSHRDLWKLSLDKPDIYSRVFEIQVDLVKNPITYQERLFTRLLFLHMSSAYSFARYSHMLAIEKLELDFAGVLTNPIPRIIWYENRRYQNVNFMKFVENSNRPRIFKKAMMKLNKITEINSSKIWHVLILSIFPDKIQEAVISLGDKVTCLTDKDEEITNEFIKRHKVDCIICFGYGKILNESVTNIIPCFNIHGGYLPYNRGPNPNLWAWIDNTPKGVTIHHIDSGIDTGDIIKQKEITFTEPISLQSSFEQTILECENLLIQEWPKIRSGNTNRQKQATKGTFHTLKSQEKLVSLLNQDGLNMPISEFCRKAESLLLGVAVEP